MKILQVIDTLNRGGAERVLVDLSNLLEKQGHHVTVLMLVSSGPLEQELNKNIKRITLHRTRKFSLRKAHEFIRIANGHDIVHLHMRHLLSYFLFSSVLFRCRAKMVFHDHWGDIDFDKRVPIAFRLLKRRIFYIGVSRKLSAWATSHANLRPTRVFSLPNIVTITPRTGVKPVKNSLLMISNFRRTKNIEFALRVVAEVRKVLPVGLDVYGRDQDREYLTELRQHAQSLGIEGAVSFFVNDDQARNKIAQYHLALHTAKSETGPLVLIEYLAYKKPFLAFHTGEVSDQLAEKLPDFFMDNFDVALWAKRVCAMLGAEKVYPDTLYDTLFDEFYSTTRYVRACESIYQKVLDDN